MNDPAVLFYTSDFLTGVIDMTMEERGQYITLLCYQHQKGHFEEKTIRLLVGLCSETIMKHFIKDDDGLFYNKRMDLEKEKRSNFVISRRENAKKGGRPKKADDKPNDKPLGYAKNNLMGNENESDNIFIKPTIKDIEIYCEERKNNIDATKFFNHYESVGWLIGKSKMKDWKACVRTWETNDKKTTTNVSKPKITQTEKGSFKIGK